MQSPLLLLDGNNLLYRSMFVKPVRDLEIGPAFSVLQTARYLVEGLAQPQIRVVAVFDGGLSERRKKLYPKYKAGRKDKSHLDFSKEEFSKQRALLIKSLKLLGANVLRYDGVEADDVVARYVYDRSWQGEDSEAGVFIFSSDLDFMQLTAFEDVLVIRPVRQGQAQHPAPFYFRLHEGQEPKDLDFIDRARFEQLHGFTPFLWPWYRAMTGDSSDGIEGVKGVGPGTASLFCTLWEQMNDIPTADDFPSRTRKRAQTALDQWDVVELNQNVIDLKIGAYNDAPEPELPPVERDFDTVRKLLGGKFGVTAIKEHSIYWFQPWERIGDGNVSSGGQ
jgi:DNA polymerase-1